MWLPSFLFSLCGPCPPSLWPSPSDGLFSIPCARAHTHTHTHTHTLSLSLSLSHTHTHTHTLTHTLIHTLSLMLISLFIFIFCAHTHTHTHTFYPAIGLNVETVTYKNLKFQGLPSLHILPEPHTFILSFFSSVIPPVWDLGGQTSIRPYWSCYYANTDAIIYVVDSADRDRLAISVSELVSILDNSVSAL